MIETLKRLLTIGGRRLEARLSGVAGFTGSGRFHYAVSPAGSADYVTELKGIAGLRCELFAQGEYVATLACNNGRVAAKFDTRLGDAEIRLDPGDVIEIRQNGCAILTGALKATGTDRTVTRSNRRPPVSAGI